MKKTMINTVHLEGFLYEHDLEAKVSGPASKNPGTPYIAGSISIATDPDCLNIVKVYYSYTTATTSKGNENRTYGTLKNILDGVLKTVMAHGKENATKVRVDSAVSLNEFYSDRNGTEEFVSVKRNEGGFIHVTDVLSEDPAARSKFECDMIISNVRRVEGDPDKETTDKVIVKGVIFDFRKAILPVEFTVTREDGMAYFEGLEASQSNPVFTKVWGLVVSETGVKKIEEESAFGAPTIKEVPTSYKDYIINAANPTPYPWDDESTITAEEFTKAISEREIYLATLKQRREDYKKSQSAATANVAAPAAGSFNF